MKLGVAYNVFDGHELLEKSILSVRNCAAFVVVVWQKIRFFRLCGLRLSLFPSSDCFAVKPAISAKRAILFLSSFWSI